MWNTKLQHSCWVIHPENKPEGSFLCCRQSKESCYMWSGGFFSHSLPSSAVHSCSPFPLSEVCSDAQFSGLWKAPWCRLQCPALCSWAHRQKKVSLQKSLTAQELKITITAPCLSLFQKPSLRLNWQIHETYWNAQKLTPTTTRYPHLCTMRGFLTDKDSSGSSTLDWHHSGASHH